MGTDGGSIAASSANGPWNQGPFVLVSLNASKTRG